MRNRIHFPQIIWIIIVVILFWLNLPLIAHKLKYTKALKHKSELCTHAALARSSQNLSISAPN